MPTYRSRVDNVGKGVKAGDEFDSNALGFSDTEIQTLVAQDHIVEVNQDGRAVAPKPAPVSSGASNTVISEASQGNATRSNAPTALGARTTPTTTGNASGVGIEGSKS